MRFIFPSGRNHYFYCTGKGRRISESYHCLCSPQLDRWGSSVPTIARNLVKGVDSLRKVKVQAASKYKLLLAQTTEGCSIPYCWMLSESLLCCWKLQVNGPKELRSSSKFTWCRLESTHAQKTCLLLGNRAVELRGKNHLDSPKNLKA